MPSAELKVYGYNFFNPVSTSSMNIEFNESQGKFDINNLDEFSNWIKIEIPDTTEFNFEDRETNKENPTNMIQNLITAINLNLDSGAITRFPNEFEEVSIEFHDDEERLYLDTGIGASDSLDEDDVIETFSDLVNLDRNNLNSRTKKEMNLIKSLLLFDKAMDVKDRFSEHMLLYMSLENAVLHNSSDGESGEDLDEKMSNATGINESKFKTWRRLYNRQKHSDHSTSDVKKSVKAIQSRDTHVVGLKRGVSKAIKDRI